MKIAFIGLGIMGSRMAANLLAGGFSLTVHNRTRDKADALVSQGARWAGTPREAAEGADVVITMLAHPQAVEQTALGEAGFLDAMASGAVWADCSTVHPGFSRRMAAEASARGVKFLDAPVAGTKQPAQDAQLVFWVGGAADAVETCRPVFGKMGRQVNHVGENGMGSSFKVVFNHMLAVTMLAFSEGVVLGESLGIPREALLNAMLGSAVVPPYLAGKRSRIESGEYEADFPLRWLQKDLQMVAEAAYETGTAMPLSNAAKEAYQLAVRAGYGDADMAAIYAFLRQNNDGI
jgi:3-hydroxyisobutyrate dehydrogenase/glyoxylate/succinic semialdehyde reductase